MYRFTYAFHAREMRFECDAGAGFENLFPETFSFHAARHDPAELYLRLEDLWSNPARLGAGAGRRDGEELVQRLLAAAPLLLQGVLDRLEASPDRKAFARASEDVAVFAQFALRFLAEKNLLDTPRLRQAGFHLRRLQWSALHTLVDERVRPESLLAFRTGTAEPVATPRDLPEPGWFYAIASGDAARIDAELLVAAERAHRDWLEGVCLDEENRAFETDASSFRDREQEVLAAVCASGRTNFRTASELCPFLRRVGNRDCLRVLSKLETWFLRQYDVPHASAIRRHADLLAAGRDHGDHVLSRHGTPSYLLALLLPSIPFLLAVFWYPRAPLLFDAWVSSEVIVVTAVAVWFLFYRFMWKKDLSFFHASVPRIGAGIIVGYLPVFLIDEVWDLAEQPAFYVVAVMALLGSTTLLYLYVEVQRRLGRPELAFARARSIFLLGLVEAAGFGVLVTSLLGPLMAARNWGPEGGDHSVETLHAVLAPFVGDLPRVLGLPGFPAFPPAILLMSFLSFFIGTFLQLLWEEIPITEPL